MYMKLTKSKVETIECVFSLRKLHPIFQLLMQIA